MPPFGRCHIAFEAAVNFVFLDAAVIAVAIDFELYFLYAVANTRLDSRRKGERDTHEMSVIPPHVPQKFCYKCT